MTLIQDFPEQRHIGPTRAKPIRLAKRRLFPFLNCFKLTYNRHFHFLRGIKEPQTIKKNNERLPEAEKISSAKPKW